MQPLHSIDAALAAARPVETGQADEARPSATRAGTSAFADMVQGLVSEVNRDQLQAEQVSKQLAQGQADVVDAMLALSRADLSLRFAVTLRNRALEAYQEIMRIQV